MICKESCLLFKNGMKKKSNLESLSCCWQTSTTTLKVCEFSPIHHRYKKIITTEANLQWVERCAPLWNCKIIKLIKNKGLWERRLDGPEACVYEGWWWWWWCVIIWSRAWTVCKNVFYFLIADTAFLAASSRSSAAVMGRPLSLRILLASCTLVPNRQKNTITAGWKQQKPQKQHLICHLQPC